MTAKKKPNTCKYPGCRAKVANNRCDYCQPHREVAAKEAVARKNKQMQLERAAWRKNNPPLCRVEGCTNPVEHAKKHKCPECEAKGRQAAQHGTIRLSVEETEAVLYIQPYKPWHRKEYPIVKTAAQVDRECRKEAKRLAEVRQRLNPELLAERVMRGAIVPYY